MCCPFLGEEARPDIQCCPGPSCYHLHLQRNSRWPVDASGQLGSQMRISQRYKIGAGLWEPVHAMGEHLDWPYPLAVKPKVFLPSSKSRLKP